MAVELTQFQSFELVKMEHVVEFLLVHDVPEPLRELAYTHEGHIGTKASHFEICIDILARLVKAHVQAHALVIAHPMFPAERGTFFLCHG